MKKMVFIIVFILIVSISAIHSQSKYDDILRLLIVSESGKMLDQIMDLFLPQFQQLFPGVPDAIWLRFRERLNIDDFLYAFVSVYDKHFTHDEIKQLIEFYESPLGQRLIEVTPLISQESMIIGQRWGERIGLEIFKELMMEGFIENQ